MDRLSPTGGGNIAVPSLYDVVVLDRELPGLRGEAPCHMHTEREHRAMVLMPTAAGRGGRR